jgi:hypothetical protein
VRAIRRAASVLLECEQSNLALSHVGSPLHLLPTGVPLKMTVVQLPWYPKFDLLHEISDPVCCLQRRFVVQLGTETVNSQEFVLSSRTIAGKQPAG